MVDDFLISNGNITSSKTDEQADLKEVHVLRGRFLHWVSIIERIMKEYCNEVNSKKMYGQLKDLFIKKLTENNLNDTTNFYEFVKALNDINPDRNTWAHGFVFYKPRSNNQPNNHINLGNNITSIQPPYFDEISKSFTTIIQWLKQNNLWKINNYSLSQFTE